MSMSANYNKRCRYTKQEVSGTAPSPKINVTNTHESKETTAKCISETNVLFNRQKVIVIPSKQNHHLQNHIKT